MKALKKLEAEQAGLKTEAGLKPGGQYLAPARRQRSRLLKAGGAIIVLSLAGGLFLMLVPLQVKLPSIPPRPIEAPVSTLPLSLGAPSVIAAAPVVMPVLPPQLLLPSAPVVQQTVQKARPKIVQKVVPSSQAAVPRPFVLTDKKTSSPSSPVPARPAVTPSAAPVAVEQVQVMRPIIPAPGQQWAAPHLVVSEIFPASGGERMAIVNGLPVMEGTMVEDAVVKEIRADQILFEIDGKLFLVALTPP